MNAGPLAMRAGLILGLALAAAAPESRAFECSAGARSFNIGPDEIRQGDLYVAGQLVDVAGILDGDLIGWAQNIAISGEVNGDLFLGGQTITIGGHIADSARVMGQTVTVTGTIDGDLLAFANQVSLSGDAVVTGDVVIFGAQAMVQGRIDGDLSANGGSVIADGAIAGTLEGTAGRVLLSGTVGEDVRITCDTFEIGPGARIEGNLEYTSREPADADFDQIVDGEVLFNVKKDDPEEQDDGGFSVGGLLFGLAWLLGEFVLGAVLVAAFRRLVPSIHDAADDEMLSSMGIGFVVIVVVPVAALILLIPLITIPLSLMTGTLWLMTLYLAKLPAAMWLGRRLLGLLGRGDPSPYVGLLLGLFLLWPLLEIPYLGWLLWFATVSLGLGAVILGLRRHLYPEGAAPEPAAG